MVCYVIINDCMLIGTRQLLAAPLEQLQGLLRGQRLGIIITISIISTVWLAWLRLGLGLLLRLCLVYHMCISCYVFDVHY